MAWTVKKRVPLQCPHCPKKYKRMFQFIRHLKKEHEGRA